MGHRLMTAAAAVLVAACSGGGATVGGVQPDGGAGDAGDGGTADGGGCRTGVETPASFCSLRKAKAGAPLTLEVREQCGSLASTTTCRVEVAGTRIDLTLDSSRCDFGPGPAVCRAGVFPCAIPALPAGVYTVNLKGPPAPPGSGVPERIIQDQLVVTPDGSQTACDLPDQPTPPTIQPSEFDRACQVDEDCALVIAGDVCTGCCPGAAIAKTALASYEKTFDERFATCDLTGRRAACACAQVRAFCTAQQLCAVRTN